MILLRKLLFPFAILYGFVTSIRNYLYDKGFFESYSYDIPVIAVGNLSVGGTGKTPQIEYLIRLLSPKYKVATLSRGYKRKSDGFILADVNANAEILGDEPYQYYQKFPNIQVAVDADRRNGIEQLLRQKDTRGKAELSEAKPEIILLDDAFQHRKVKAGFYILLTAYDDLYCDDFMLPTGNLRESRSGAKRADVIIVTKCPPTISETEQDNIRKKIGTTLPVFFSSIDYDGQVYSSTGQLGINEIKAQRKILLAGIAKPEPFYNFLQSGQDEILTFSDHHNFTESEIADTIKKAKDKIIITTEKDFVRLNNKITERQIYYLPIKSKFIDQQEAFDKIIIDYVGSSAGNR